MKYFLPGRFYLLKEFMSKGLQHFFTLFLFLVIAGCAKKYPDDKFYTLKSSKKRLEGPAGARFSWHIDKIMINGEDATHKYNDTLAPNVCSDFHFTFDFDYDPRSGRNRYDLVHININHPGLTFQNSEIATWGVSLNTKSERFGFTRPGQFNIINDSTQDARLSRFLFYPWTIEKLWKNNFNIKSNRDNKTYEVYFSK